MTLSATARGTLCATGSATRREQAGSADPARRPDAGRGDAAQASRESLAPGAVIGHLHDVYLHEQGRRISPTSAERGLSRQP